MTLNSTNTRAELVDTWHRALSVMHIAHHIAASRYAKWHRWLVATSAVLVAIVGAVAFLNLEQRAARHLEAAADFMRLRREMEDERIRTKEGNPSDNYDAFLDRWHCVLRSVPPLPQRIHDRVQKDIDIAHKE